MSDLALILLVRDTGRALLDTLDACDRLEPSPAELLVVAGGSRDLATRKILADRAATGRRVLEASGSLGEVATVAVGHTSSARILLLDERARLEADALAGLDPPTPEEGAIIGWHEGGSPPTEVGLLAGEPLPVGAVPRASWMAVGSSTEPSEAWERDLWIRLLTRHRFHSLGPLPLRGPAPGERSRRRHRRPPSRALVHLHRSLAESRHRDLLVAKERLVLGLRERIASLEDRRGAVQAELDQARGRVGELLGHLGARGEGRIDFGDLRRTRPHSPVWGVDRGLPIDRHYLHAFLERHRLDISGRVLEIKEPVYTERFGGDRVTHGDVLDLDPDNPRATLVADLADAGAIPPDRYDCVLLTQMLNEIRDVPTALGQALRILRPGGVLLASVSALNRLSHEQQEGDGDYWRFTEAGLGSLLAVHLPLASFEITGHGNVLAAIAFLHGLAADELHPAELADHDRYVPILYTVRAKKPSRRIGRAPTKQPETTDRIGAAVLAYERVDPDLLGAHLEALHGRWRAVDLEEIVDAVLRGVDPRGIAITLDGGAIEHFQDVAPFLDRLGVPATYFVPACALEPGGPRWLPGRRRSRGGDLSSLARRRRQTIGAGGFDALDLRGQPDEILERELDGARHAFETTLGVAPSLLAYPFGGHDPGAVAAAVAAGNRAAFTLEPALVTATSDPFRLPRIPADALSADELVATLERLRADQPNRAKA